MWFHTFSRFLSKIEKNHECTVSSTPHAGPSNKAALQIHLACGRYEHRHIYTVHATCVFPPPFQPTSPSIYPCRKHRSTTDAQCLQRCSGVDGQTARRQTTNQHPPAPASPPPSARRGKAMTQFSATISASEWMLWRRLHSTDTERRTRTFSRADCGERTCARSG